MSVFPIYLLNIVLALFYYLPVQESSSFQVYCYPSRFDTKSEEYFRNNGFVTDNIQIMTQGSIVYADDKSNFDPARVKRFLSKNFPDRDNTSMVLLDWEAGPYDDLKNFPATDSRFKAAENKLIALLNEVRQHRPNLKLAFYGIPFRAWYDWQKQKYNPSGKYDRLLSEVDWIAPSLYILFADEEVGHARNLQYLRDNLDPALVYGKKYNKPVIPYVWHRIHAASDDYPHDIIQKEVFAKYIRYVSAYSLNGYKASGVYWWDNQGGRLDDLSGIDNHLKGTVYDAATYDAMIVDYAAAVKKELR